MVPPKPPAPSGINFEGKYNLRTLHDGTQSSQHGDVLFLDYTYCSIFLVTILLITSDQHARGQKVSF